MGWILFKVKRGSKQHKSHRGYAEQMDAKLEQLYFPLGRNVDESVPALDDIVENRPEVENEVEIDDNNDTWDQIVEAMISDEDGNLDFRRMNL